MKRFALVVSFFWTFVLAQSAATYGASPLLFNAYNRKAAELRPKVVRGTPGSFTKYYFEEAINQDTCDSCGTAIVATACGIVPLALDAIALPFQIIFSPITFARANRRKNIRVLTSILFQGEIRFLEDHGVQHQLREIGKKVGLFGMEDLDQLRNLAKRFERSDSQVARALVILDRDKEEADKLPRLSQFESRLGEILADLPEEKTNSEEAYLKEAEKLNSH